ncbi:zinc finger protein 624-like [Malaya genurostris]|uniref:zinc finger protein 624-like n=1 Tax=Malaya genurostris TaxID=325434 RepID=UPI0026F40776|nr:zinc finger protein 624-like [Malaya genurostris]
MESLDLLTCRLCLSVPMENVLTFSVFDTFKSKILRDIINYLFSIKITKDDHLLTVCMECISCINTVQKIHQKFTESNEKFKQLLASFAEDSREVELLIIEDIDQVLQNTSPKASNLEIEILSITAATEDTLNEDVEKNLINEQSELESNEIDTEKAMKNESLTDELTANIISTSHENSKAVSNVRDKKIKNEAVDIRIQLHKHKCYLCKTSFDSEIAFIEHLHVHFEELPITCEKCNNIVLKSVRQASKHLALHDENERPYKCRICELRFFTRENSLTHERKIHRMKVRIQQNIDGYADKRKIKKYQCSYCGQLSPTSDCLRKHELLHGSSRQLHTCTVCSRQFTARKNLTRHMMIHTGELPYKCDFCDRAFRQAGDLKDHVRGHTKENPYICTVCGACFRNGKILLVHKKKHHPKWVT